MMSRIYLVVLALLSVFVWVTSNTVAVMAESEYSDICRFRPDVVAQSIEVVADSSDAQNTIRGASDGGNIALGKPTATSSIEGASNRTGAQAVDGMSDTRWSSEHSDIQWIQIDLGGNHHITAVILEWEIAYARSYELQVSDNGTTWTTIFRMTDSGGGLEIIRGLSGTGRYIRMYGVERATRWGISLWEFEVYGTTTEEMNNVPNQPDELQVS